MQGYYPHRNETKSVYYKSDLYGLPVDIIPATTERNAAWPLGTGEERFIP
jgi:hypothetical protein